MPSILAPYRNARFSSVALLAAFVAIFSVSAVMRLMPLKTRQAVIIAGGEQEFDEVDMSLKKLSKGHEPANIAISRFFLAQYVTSREGYEISQFTNKLSLCAPIVMKAAYAEYLQTYDPAVSSSPFAGLGEAGQRQIAIEDVRAEGAPEGSPNARAVVYFNGGSTH